MACENCVKYDKIIEYENQGYKCCPYCGENIRDARGKAWVKHINEVLDESELKMRASKEFVEIDGEVLEYERKPWSNNMPRMKLDMDVCIDKEIKMLNDYFKTNKRLGR